MKAKINSQKENTEKYICSLKDLKSVAMYCDKQDQNKADLVI